MALLAQGEDHGGVVGGLHVDDVGQTEEEAGVGAVSGVLIGPDDVLGQHLVAVCEGGVGVDVEGPGQLVLAGLPALSDDALQVGGVGHGVAVGVGGGLVLHQAVIGGVLESGGSTVSLVPGVQGAAQRGGGNDDIVAGGGRRIAGAGVRAGVSAGVGVGVLCAGTQGQNHGSTQQERSETLPCLHSLYLFSLILLTFFT